MAETEVGKNGIISQIAPLTRSKVSPPADREVDPLLKKVAGPKSVVTADSQVAAIQVKQRAAEASEIAQEASQVAEEALSVEEMRSLVEKLTASMPSNANSLRFQIDEILDRPIVSVIDEKSGKLIRQLPSEEVVRAARNIEIMRGVLFDSD